MKDWRKKLRDKLVIGDPPRLINAFILGSWFIFVPSVIDLGQFVLLVYQPKKHSPESKWGSLGFNRNLVVGANIFSNVAARFAATLVAPVVDSYKLLHFFYIASLASGLVLFVAMAAQVFPLSTGLEHQKYMLCFVLPTVMNFFRPFVVAFTVQQFNDKVGPKARMLFTVLYTAQYAFMGFCTLAFFPEAPKHPDATLWCILAFSLFAIVLCLALLVVITVLVIQKRLITKGGYRKGETRDCLVCLLKGLCRFMRIKMFNRFFKVHSEKTVDDTKIFVKILFILFAMGFMMSTVEMWQTSMVRQYVYATASFLSRVEYVTVTNILAAILIPVVQFALLPRLQKMKIPLSPYSMLLCGGYLWLLAAFSANLIYRAEIGPVELRYNIETKEALYYTLNAMDTHTYVSEGGLKREIIPPGSFNRLRLKVGKKLRVMNFWYDANFSKRIKSYDDDLIICTSQGIYQEYLGDFGWPDGHSAAHITIPKITFLCQKDPTTGGPTDYCNDRTKYILKKDESTVATMHMPNGSRPFDTTLSLDAGQTYSVDVEFHGKPLNVEEANTTFVPYFGAWYVLVVWSGDVHLKIKYQLVTIRSPFEIDTFAAIPHVIFAALATSFLQVVISCIIHINIRESLTATTWALHFFLERFACPIFVFFLNRSLGVQLTLLLLAGIFFIILMSALRVGRYK